jgi:hypothetical protein
MYDARALQVNLEWKTWRMGIAILVAAIAACGTPLPTATPSTGPLAAANEFQVSLPPDVIVTVIDHTGAVFAVDAWAPDASLWMPEFDRGRVATISEAPYVVRVNWLGRPCHTRPSVVISGDATESQFDVFSGPLPAGVACPDLDITRGVYLAMTAVPEAHVNRYHEGSPP